MSLLRFTGSPNPTPPPGTNDIDIDQALQNVLNKSGIDAARLALGVEGLQGFVNPADHGFGPGNITVGSKSNPGDFQHFLDNNIKIVFPPGEFVFDTEIAVRNDHFLLGAGFGSVRPADNTILKFSQSSGIVPEEEQLGDNPSRVSRVTIANLAILGDDNETGQHNVGVHMAQAVRWLLHRCIVENFGTNVRIDGGSHPGNSGISGAILNLVAYCNILQDDPPHLSSFDYLNYGIACVGDNDDFGRAEINTIIGCEIYGENNASETTTNAPAAYTDNGTATTNVRGPYLVEINGNQDLRREDINDSNSPFIETAVHVFVNGVQVPRLDGSTVNWRQFTDDAAAATEVGATAGTTFGASGIAPSRPGIVFDAAFSPMPVADDVISVRQLDAPGKAAVLFEQGQGNNLISCGVGGYKKGIHFNDRHNFWLGGYGQICEEALLFFGGARLDMSQAGGNGKAIPKTISIGSNNYVAPNISMTDQTIFQAVKFGAAVKAKEADPPHPDPAGFSLDDPAFRGENNIYAPHGAVAVLREMLPADPPTGTPPPDEDFDAYVLNAEGSFLGPAELAPIYTAEFEGTRLIRARIRIRLIGMGFIPNPGTPPPANILVEDATLPVKANISLRRRIGIQPLSLTEWGDAANEGTLWAEVWKNQIEADSGPLLEDLVMDAWDRTDDMRGSRQYRLLLQMPTVADMGHHQQLKLRTDQYPIYISVEEKSDV